MRILAFSDLHRDASRARRLAETSAQVDLVVGAGDFASFRLGLGPMIEALSAIRVPAVLVPGNNESERALRREAERWPAAHVLHGEAVRVAGIEVYGLGLAVPPAPFPWSANCSERTAERLLEPMPEDALLVTHSPPRGHCDVAHGRHLGSRSVLAAIVARRPRLVLCGHIHESWGKESRIGATRILNLGPEGRMIDV